METILNLVWLAITLSAIWVWRCRWSFARQNPSHSTRQEAIALICFIALSFPVISLTDDLHPEIMVADAVGSKRNASLMISAAPHLRATTAGPSIIHSGPGLVSSQLQFDPSGAAESVFTRSPGATEWLAGGSSGRSPPSFL